MIVSANTIRFLKEDSKERISVGDKFNGKFVRLDIGENAPIEEINAKGFSIDCNQYLKANNYAGMGLPVVEEPDPSGREIYLSGTQLQFSPSVISVFVLHSSMVMLFHK